MPRNSSGNYSLPSGNPVSPETLIESLWANTTLADVGQALTESLDRYGRGTMLAAFRVADGTVTAPGVAFGSEASTGIYRGGAGIMGLSVLGVAKATLTAAAFTFNTAPTWASDPASGNQLTRKTYVDNAIATAGGAFLPLTGGTMTGAITLPAGTVSLPALRLDDSNTGIYSVGANIIGIATGGIHRITIDVNGISGAGSGLTALNASNLASGTVADARISGSYTGITNLTASGVVSAGAAAFGPASAAPLALTRTGSAINVSIGYTTDGGSLWAGNSDGSTFTIGASSNLASGANQWLNVSSSLVQAPNGAVFTGNGSGLTALNASQLTSGTVPNARISGSYSGLVNLDATGTLTVGGGGNGIAKVAPGGATTSGYIGFHSAASGTRQGYIGYSNTDAAADTGTIRHFAGTHEFNGAITNTGSGFNGNGSGLTSLNASNLSSGTVADARISGAYSGISTLTLTDQLRLPAGTAALPSLRWLGDTDTGLYAPGVSQVAICTTGTDRLVVNDGGADVTGGLDVSGAVTGASFSGSGSGLTSLNASNLSSGTVPNARISGAYSGISNLTVTGRFFGPDGSTSTPAFSFTDDTNTGIYRFAENDMRITCGGTSVFSFAVGVLTALASTDVVIGTATEPTATGSVGYRGMPVTTVNSTTAFGLSESGQTRRKSNTTAYTWTINPDATTNFPIGTVVFLLHDSTAGNITVARGAGVALVEGTTDANATLTAGERASIHKVAANRWRLYR